jgi:Domain of unknown function DUF29
LTVLYAHMLKWDFQPNYRSRSWETSIREQRSRIAKLLAKNSSLKSKLDEAREEANEYGRDGTSSKTGLPMDAIPKTSPCIWQEVTERKFRLEEALFRSRPAPNRALGRNPAMRHRVGVRRPRSLSAFGGRFGSGWVLRTASVSISRSSALVLVGSRVKDFCHVATENMWGCQRQN